MEYFTYSLINYLRGEETDGMLLLIIAGIT